jgi:hypothetical protein
MRRFKKAQNNMKNRKISTKIKAMFQKEQHPVMYYVQSTHASVEPKAVPIHRIHESVFQENHEQSAHPDHTFQKAIFSWIAPEYQQHTKTSRWWLIAGIIYLAAIIGEIITKNWSFLVATLVLAPVYWYIHEFHPPKYTKVILSEAGIKIGNRTIPFSQMVSFWIFYEPKVLKTLNFRLHKGAFNELVIQLEDQDPVAIREFLQQYIPELEGKSEEWTSVLLRLLKL